jgi:hypothetical protein
LLREPPKEPLREVLLLELLPKLTLRPLSIERFCPKLWLRWVFTLPSKRVMLDERSRPPLKFPPPL